MENLQIFQVDSFTAQPFKGNPAGVCLLNHPADERWMQDVAREMNLSETAFLLPEGIGYRLRWFTPGREVELCGHATLAAAHILWEEKIREAAETAHFYTLSGELQARRAGAWIELDFPLETETETAEPEGLAAVLGAELRYVGRSRLDYLVEVGSAQVLRSLRPDFRALEKITARGIMATSLPDSGEFDFLSRFFAPAYGIDEDPVTGSAHCTLAPFWGARLGKTEMTGYQASSRGGVVKVRLQAGRVILCGRAVTVISGKLI